METITSKANALCVHLRKLASSRSYREETGEFLCDSPKLLREAAQWGAPVQALLYTEGVELPRELEGRVPRLAKVSESVMRSVSPMETPQGAVFSCRFPDCGLPERLSAVPGAGRRAGPGECGDHPPHGGRLRSLGDPAPRLRRSL